MGMMAVEKAITRRSAFTEPERMRRAFAPRRKTLTLEIATAESNDVRAPAKERFDHRNDGVAVRDQPSDDPVDDRRNERCAKNRSSEAQEDRAAECVIESIYGDAAESPVKPLHDRHDDCAHGDDAKRERNAVSEAWGTVRNAGSIGRGDFAANAQAAHRQDRCQ